MGYIDDRYDRKFGTQDGELADAAIDFDIETDVEATLRDIFDRILGDSPADPIRRMTQRTTSEDRHRFSQLIDAERAIADWNFGIPKMSVFGVVNNSVIDTDKFADTGEVEYGKGSEIIIQLNWVGTAEEVRDIQDKIRKYNWESRGLSGNLKRIVFEPLMSTITRPGILTTAPEERDVTAERRPILAFLSFYPVG